MSRRLVAGPYLGEFGWELCCWNPRLRALARDYDEVVVLAPARSRPLYEFATRFVPVNARPGSSDYMSGELEGALPSVSGRGWSVRPAPSTVAEELRALTDPAVASAVAAAKAWRRFAWESLPASPPLEVCLALRGPKALGGKLYTRKAWAPIHADAFGAMLLERGLRVAVVGGPDNRGLPGALDLRGAPLEQQIAALANAGVTVGPSSGPMHLAQLCGSAVVTWYDASPDQRRLSRLRYESAWNPWRARLEYLEGVPDAEEALRATLRLLEPPLRAA